MREEIKLIDMYLGKLSGIVRSYENAMAYSGRVVVKKQIIAVRREIARVRIERKRLSRLAKVAA